MTSLTFSHPLDAALLTIYERDPSRIARYFAISNHVFRDEAWRYTAQLEDFKTSERDWDVIAEALGVQLQINEGGATTQYGTSGPLGNIRVLETPGEYGVYEVQSDSFQFVPKLKLDASLPPITRRTLRPRRPFPPELTVLPDRPGQERPLEARADTWARQLRLLGSPPADAQPAEPATPDSPVTPVMRPPIRMERPVRPVAPIPFRLPPPPAPPQEERGEESPQLPSPVPMVPPPPAEEEEELSPLTELLADVTYAAERVWTRQQLRAMEPDDGAESRRVYYGEIRAQQQRIAMQWKQVKKVVGKRELSAREQYWMQQALSKYAQAIGGTGAEYKVNALGEVSANTRYAVPVVSNARNYHPWSL